MATIALVGATSTLAGHIAKRLRENGHTLRLLSATGASEPTDAELVVVGDTPTCSACVQHLHGVDVVVLVATPSRRTWVDAAVTAACPLVD